jgi:deoxyribose-phosphate aldolase
MDSETYRIAEKFSHIMKRSFELDQEYIYKLPTAGSRKDLVAYIDHTNLKPDATKKSIEVFSLEAKLNKFCSVCINPVWITTAKKILRDSPVKVCTVIAFPLGATSTMTKTFEASKAIKDGADELDMVINIGALKSGLFDFVLKDIEAVVKSAKKFDVITKVIIETSFLTKTEIIQASLLAKWAGADFIKTSTGYSAKGAIYDNVVLMRQIAQDDMGVKASGGISDYRTAFEMMKAGANRLGCSNSLNIVKS